MNIWRYRLATWSIRLGLWVMPESRYKRELNKALWVLALHVQAHCAALHAADEEGRGVS